MLRFKVLVSVVPLIGAAILARLELTPAPRPCISLDAGILQIATIPIRRTFTSASPTTPRAPASGWR
jgi:hypothetical protein